MRQTGIDPRGKPPRAKKSAISLRREKQATQIFNSKLVELAGSNLSSDVHCSGLVNPAIHLTNECFKDFRKVVNAAQSTVTRREATDLEKKSLGILQKRKCYFLDVHFPSTAIEKARRLIYGASRSSSSSSFSSSSSSTSYAGGEIEVVGQLNLMETLQQNARGNQCSRFIPAVKIYRYFLFFTG